MCLLVSLLQAWQLITYLLITCKALLLWGDRLKQKFLKPLKHFKNDAKEKIYTFTSYGGGRR